MRAHFFKPLIARTLGRLGGEHIRRKSLASVCAFLASLAATAHAEAQACRQITATTFNGSVDAYSYETYRPGGFRALSGLGDPHINGFDGLDYYSARRGDDGVLLQRIFPPNAEGADRWDPYGHCRVDYALETLKTRIARFGASSAYVSSWIAMQRWVFAGCGPTGANADTAPPALPTHDMALQRLQADDRAYQIASAKFYRGMSDAAFADFRTIATSTSPHRPIARYMIAAIHAGTTGENEWGQLKDGEGAAAEARAILADPALHDAHALALQLLGWLAYNSRSPALRARHVHAMLNALQAPIGSLNDDPIARQSYGRAIADLDYLGSASFQAEARTNVMARWLTIPRPLFLASFAERADQNSRLDAELRQQMLADAAKPGPAGRAWRVMAFNFSNTYDPARWREIEAEQSAGLCGDDAALAAFSQDFYNQVRTALIHPGAVSDGSLAQVIAHFSASPPGDSYYLSRLRVEVLQTLMMQGRISDARVWRNAEFAHLASDASAAPSLAILAEDENQLAALLQQYRGAPNPADFLNNLSIAELRHLSVRSDIHPAYRALFARIAWTRAYALGRPIDAQLDITMRDANPELTRAWRSPRGAHAPQDRQLLLDVLRSPGLNLVIWQNARTEHLDAGVSNYDQPGSAALDRYYHTNNNWWCAWSLHPDAVSRAYSGFRAAFASSFLIRNVDRNEQLAMSQIACGPKLFANRAIDWARNPGWFDNRNDIAEALALAIASTRNGCQRNGPHGAYSRQAYLLLHTRFADSAAARRTHYWFNCLWNACGPEDE